MVGLEGIDKEVSEYKHLQNIIHDLLNRVDAHPGYELKKGRLLHKGRLVLP